MPNGKRLDFPQMKDPLEELEYEDDQKMTGEVDAADEDKESISP